MENTYEQMAEKLKQAGIRASHHRVRVLDYLINHPCHPTVDQIFQALYEDIPSLSRTTVYNTLSTFKEVGLVRELTIEEHESRYDIMTENHGHFKCESCGRICNFAMDLDSWIPEELRSYQINQKDAYFKGICPDCLTKEKTP